MSNQAALASQWMATTAQRVDKAIETSFQNWDVSAQQLKEAMHYAAIGGGKRIRPLLVYATAALSGKQLDDIPGIDHCADYFSISMLMQLASKMFKIALIPITRGFLNSRG